MRLHKIASVFSLCLSLAFGAHVEESAAATRPSKREGFVWAQRQFNLLRDVHTNAYAFNPLWIRHWETHKYSKNGLNFLHGSLSAEDLHTVREAVLNKTMWDGEALFRFSHAEYDTYGIHVLTNEIEAHWRILGPLAITLFGDPVFEKARASMGAGIFISDESRTQYLNLRFNWDDIIFNDKSRDDALYEKPFWMIQGEANVELGALRAYAFWDWGLEKRVVYENPLGSNGARDHRDWLRRVTAKIEWGPLDRLFGAKYDYSGRFDQKEHFETYENPELYLDDYVFTRRSHRLDLYHDGSHENYRWRLQAGRLEQRDKARFDRTEDYDFALDEWLFGGRFYYGGLAEGLTLGVGYWGNIFSARRDIDESTLIHSPLRSDRRWESYTDKADFVIHYVVDEDIRIEIVSSQEIANGHFGGSSGKLLLLF